MINWTSEELDAIAKDKKLYISIPNADGTMHAPTWVSVVQSGKNVYIRSYSGTEGLWYKAAKAAGHGHVSVGGIEKDVTFEFPTDKITNDAIDEGYRKKYAGSQSLEAMLGKKQLEATVMLMSVVSPNGAS